MYKIWSNLSKNFKNLAVLQTVNLFVVRLNSNLRNISRAIYLQNVMNFLPKGCTFFINHSVDIVTYFIILSCSLHIKTAFCMVALMTVYTAEYLLVLAGSGTAGVKDKVV